MYALRERLTKRVGVAIDNVAFGWLVVTPDVDLAGGFEWDDDAYCGRGPFNRSLDKAVDRACKILDWQTTEQAPDQQGAARTRSCTIYGRPSTVRRYLMPGRACSTRAMVRLTDQQYARLDLISDEPRVICSGGAGTGKTFLAAEVARRQAPSRSACALYLPERSPGGLCQTNPRGRQSRSRRPRN